MYKQLLIVLSTLMTAAVALLALPATAVGIEFSTFMSQPGGSSPDSIDVNVPFTVYVCAEWQTGDGDRLAWSSPFMFYGTDDVTSVVVVNPPAVAPDFEAVWDMYIGEFLESWDGDLTTPDQWNFTGVDFNAPHLPESGFDTIFTFEFTIPGDYPTSGTFCIDAGDFANNTYDWLFEPPSPSFGGPYCWPVAAPQTGPTTGGQVYLGSVDGLVDGKIEAGGGPVTFHIHYQNYDLDDNVTTITNGFQLSASGGVSWTNGAYGDEFSWGPAGDNFFIWQTATLSWDGSGADTICFSGMDMTGNAGLPAGYDGPAVYLSVDIDDSLTSSGETFCIDSCFFPPSVPWLWLWDGGGTHAPSWDGPHCFEIVPALNADDVYWSDKFGPYVPPLNGRVNAMINYNGNLIAGGGFTDAGGKSNADYIARWDGTEWQPLGDGLNDSVMALEVWNGNLVVGGKFTDAGDLIDADHIAAWNGSSWSALGSGTNATVRALTVSSGNLIAGGSFSSAGGNSANYIAQWNGSTWSGIGGGMNNEVLALEVYNGSLIAGGLFTTAGGFEANRIARWDGFIFWSGLGSGMNNTVRTLTVFDGQLIAGGGFTTAGGEAAERIAAWNGSSWSSLGVMHSWVNALEVVDDVLYAGGQFINAGGVPASRIAAYNGSTWSALGVGVDDYVWSLASYNGKVVAGGDFATAGVRFANHIALWDGADWHDFYGGSGLDDDVDCIGAYDGQLVVGGYFQDAGGDLQADHIASYDGTGWSPLGSGVAGGWYNQVVALVEYDGDLIAGGNFQTAGGISANNIASWNGNGWSALGSGLGYAGTYVHCLEVFNGDLVAGGQFSSPVEDIAVWNGSTWQALGSSGVSGSGGNVLALIVWGEQLIAAGDFETIDGVAAANIATWNGAAWSPLGAGADDDVHGLAVYDGKLIAAGLFVTIGGETCNGIAAWDGSAWSSLGSGVTGNFDRVNNVIPYGNLLIAGGSFATAGAAEANNIAAWDGTAWSALGSGTDPEVYAVGVSPIDGSLFAGGYFTTAGMKPSSHIANWTKPAGCCMALTTPLGRGNVDYDAGDAIDISDLVYLVDYMFSGGAEPPCWDEADIDGSSGGASDSSDIDISDLVYLVDYMFSGGPQPVACQ